jgi:hypothetical protein
MLFLAIDDQYAMFLTHFRFVVSASPSTLTTFEQALFGPFTLILQQDIDRMYIVYIDT